MATSALATTTIDKKGQLTLPKKFREKLSRSPGAPIGVMPFGSGVVLLPAPSAFEKLCAQVSSTVAKTEPTMEEIIASLSVIRKKLYAERYGDLKKGRKRRSQNGK